jgi:predicted small secreted protein
VQLWIGGPDVRGLIAERITVQMRKDLRSIGRYRLRRAPLLLSLLAGACWALAACNTTEGLGRDVKSLGKGVEETASDAKN